MTEGVNSAMLELQGALLSRALYPTGHPRIRAGESQALTLLREVLDERVEVSLFAVEDRVVFNGTPLPASGSLLDGLFRVLRENGIDRLTFRRGIKDSELRSVLDSLSAAVDEPESPEESRHVKFGYLDAAQRPKPPPVDPGAAGNEPVGDGPPQDGGGSRGSADASDAFATIWGDMETGRQLDVDGVGDVVSAISKVIGDSSGAMLPLAPLKQHDEYTFVHTINVAILSASMAEAVGFGPNATHELSMSALLHDVGKQLVSTEVLNKKGRFNDEERAEMERHPIYGARVLMATEGVPELAPIVAFEHHIRADLSGYPAVPKGWKLNLASRIVQLADVFDALRTHRPYRPALPAAKIIEIMRGDVGPFFDGDLLQIFLQCVVDRGIPEPPPLEAASSDFS